MNLKQKVQFFLASLFIVFGITAFATPPQVFAAATVTGNNGCGTDTTIIKCDNVTVKNNGVENTAVWSLLLTAIKILSVGVGVAAVGGVVYGAILYTSAGGNQEQVKKAMGIITNVVIGVIAYALMFSLLNFLIPGGLFN